MQQNITTGSNSNTATKIQQDSICTYIKGGGEEMVRDNMDETDWEEIIDAMKMQHSETTYPRWL